MAEDAKPALTEEEQEDALEWTAWFRLDALERARLLKYAREEADAYGYTGNRLLAAKALHGQPFGFTREDVEQLRKLAIRDSRTYGPPEDHFGWRIADRIAALLPPEPTDG